MIEILNLIDGALVPAKEQFDNVNPATGQVYSRGPRSQKSDVQLAIAAAERAFPEWSRRTAEARGLCLRKLADLIEANLEKFAQAESLDSGKPVSLALEIEIPRACANLRFFADAIGQFRGESFQTGSRAMNWTQYSPLGVVACISPWNLPLYLLTWKIAPALAAGNTVVAKPSEVTPYTAYLMSELVKQSGFPDGVLNIVHGTGSEVGAPLVEDPRIKAVSFTGSTQTGRTIANSVAGQFKKLSLEMGGKNPNIIFADCDYEKALETTVRSSFQNQGQICLCGSRIFIEKSIYSKFVTDLVERAKSLRIGDPLDRKTQQGAMVSKSHFEKVMGFFGVAKQEGVQIRCGGSAATMSGAQAGGYFIQPTVLENVKTSSALFQEEIFGPVVSVHPFETEAEVLELANGTRYGLSATIWTRDVSRAQRVASQLKAGLVWINTWMLRDLRVPFGGVKESGLGREGGNEALKFFTEVTTVTVNMEA